MIKGRLQRYKTKKEHLSYIKNLLEGYDNMAIMTTVDAAQGIFELKVPPGMKGETDRVMAAISGEVEVEEISYI